MESSNAESSPHARSDGKVDVDALHAALVAHHSRLLAYVQSVMPQELRRVFEPNDVVQDVMFAAFRRLPTFSPRGDDALFAWLATIARNTLTDLVRMHRAAKRGKATPLSADESRVLELMQQLAVYRRTPSQSAAAHEFMSALEESLKRLPEDYHRVVTLRHLEGLSLAETAEKMRRTTGAVAMLSSRAMEAIRHDLRSISLFV